MKMMSPRPFEYSALLTLVVFISVTVDLVDSQARVCYFGPPPDPGPSATDSQPWMSQILPEIRQRCPGKAIMPCVAQRQGDATTESTKECLNPEPLGLGDGSIPDERFRASDYFASYFASNARLNHDSYWQPHTFPNSWVEVDLVYDTLVSGVVTQGSGDVYYKRVTKYKVRYQTLSSSFSVYKYITDGNGSIQVFDGNMDDSTTPVTNFFYHTIHANVVRMEPANREDQIALQFELLGCKIN